MLLNIMGNQIETAVKSVLENANSFYKKISLTDSGKTSHQNGIYISKSSAQIILDELGKRGENKDMLINIKWYDGKKSNCRVIYYGKGTRNEYRITRLSRKFIVGQFLILTKIATSDYYGFILEEEEIPEFYSKLEINK